MKTKTIGKLLVAVMLAVFLVMALPANVSADDSCGSDEADSSGEETENELQILGKEGTFNVGSGKLYYENGKPVIRYFGTTWCPHCKWIRDTFDKVALEYVQKGQIVAYHWELDTKDNRLTDDIETEIPQSEWDILRTFSPEYKVPTFVFGGKYWRVGNGYERMDNLKAEENEFRTIIEKLIENDEALLEVIDSVDSDYWEESNSSCAITYDDISVNEAKQIIDSNEDVVILDVRTSSEYTSQHLARAISIPLSEFDLRLDELDTEKTIIVYSKSGGKSQDASKILAQNGFENVHNMQGGIDEWMFAGFEVTDSVSSELEGDNNESQGYGDGSIEEDTTSPTQDQENRAAALNLKDTVFYTFITAIIIEGIIGLFVITGSKKAKVHRRNKHAKIAGKIGALFVTGVFLGTAFQVLFAGDISENPWGTSTMEDVVVIPTRTLPGGSPTAPMGSVLRYSNGELLTPDEVSALEREGHMVFVEDRHGNQIGYYELEEREDGKFDLYIWTADSRVQILIEGLEEQPRGLLVKIDSVFDDEVNELIDLLRSLGLVVQSSNAADFSTDVVYIDPVKMDRTVVTISTVGKVRSILHDPAFDPVGFTTRGWELTDITFTENHGKVTFELETLGAYVGSSKDPSTGDTSSPDDGSPANPDTSGDDEQDGVPDDGQPDGEIPGDDVTDPPIGNGNPPDGGGPPSDNPISIDKGPSILPYDGNPLYQFAVTQTPLESFFAEKLGPKASVKVTAEPLDGEEAFVEFIPGSMILKSDDGNILQKTEFSKSTGDFTDNVATYENTYPSTDYEFIVTKEKLKHNIILYKPPEVPEGEDTSDMTLEFEGVLKLPDEMTMHVEGEQMTGDFSTWKTVELRDGFENSRFSILPPLTYDSSEPIIKRLSTYNIRHEDGNVLFSVATSVDWLMGATYPVVIDPTVLLLPVMTWVSQGPSPIIDGQVEHIPGNNPVVGAIHTVVAHPENPDIIWVGTVNGGIWKTTDATSPSPTWMPKTDFESSLSISALELDPNDPTHNTLIAGIGRASAKAREGGPRTGLLRSTDGGVTWSDEGNLYDTSLDDRPYSYHGTFVSRLHDGALVVFPFRADRSDPHQPFFSD
ncbi:MAG: hypothetical protein JSW28_06805, partial [Thermoplasmata archaeon]